MISEGFLVYFMFQMIVLVINIIGYSEIPELRFFGIIFSLAISVQTIIAFSPDYWVVGAILILMNVALPTYSLSRGFKK
jgi:hypothetical protein